ncbi:MAG: redoxin domain-containing protein [Alphaproteobacteria bacterium]|nr:redoxin domain-containing protein [Alphaproteobacteria bacterium]
MPSIEIGLSFIEGLALIASPCILPVLPLVLGASVEGGKRRPFGIIIGFVLAFTAFAMLSRKLVYTLGIDLEYIKYGSLIFLALFGLVLLSERLSAIFSGATQRFASAGSNITANAKDGFFSGIFIGMLIGLIWTPCAGPILAAVLVQIIRQESDIQALFLVSAFATGVGIPMLVISLTGRKIMSKLGFLTHHAEAVRKTFGVVILLAVGFIASGVDAQSLFTKKESAPIASVSGLQDALPNPYPAPEFTGIQQWLNTNPLIMQELKGKVVLIDFWTYSCINCVRTLPYITKWDRTYRDKGLVIIGVHAPEFEFEKDVSNVKNALQAHNIEYPVAIDNKLDTWTAFKNSYWPAHYLIDKEGKIVYTHFGEGNYAETENNIRHLLGLGAKAEAGSETPVISKGQTPETYLGASRAEHFASPEKLVGDSANFSLPKFLPTDHWALSGEWRVENERIVSQQAGAKLQLNFTTGKVFLVLGTQTGKPITATLALNGEPLGAAAGKDAPGGVLTVKNHTLYELVNQESVKNGLLEITANEPGLEAYAFTFGN